MALLLKNGAVFLHIPKTGGNWVSSVLYKSGLVKSSIGHKHADIERVLLPLDNDGRWTLTTEHGRSLTSYHLKRKLRLLPSSKPFMFCFVRHPLKWYESWFKYMSQPNRNWCDWGREESINYWHPNAMLNGLGTSEFNQFIKNIIAKRPGFVTELFGWYTKPQIDFVGKQENLTDDLITVLRQLDLPFDEDFVRNYKAVNVSPKPKQEMVWEPELRTEVIKLEYAGLKRYNYDTENW